MQQNCSDLEIRSAYRRLALQMHPDHNDASPESAEAFRHLTDAYETLNNPELRRKYDLEQQSWQLRHLLQPAAATTPSTSTYMSSHIYHTVQVSLQDLYHGKMKRFQVSRTAPCTSCSKKQQQQQSMNTLLCSSCHGKGHRSIKTANNKIKQTCGDCKGKGAKPTVTANCCEACANSKLITEAAVFKVHIDAGMQHGQSIIFENEGDVIGNDEQRGHVIFTVEQLPHEQFVRKGNDLYVKHALSWTEAIQGHFKLRHLDGRLLHVKSKTPLVGKKSSNVKCLSMHGMPIYQGEKTFGNLYIYLSVEKNSGVDMSRLHDLLPSHLINNKEETLEKSLLLLDDVNCKQQVPFPSH